jgi:N6-adenosine-specific RNA methylase IME4
VFEQLPKRHFRAILADPPWYYKSRTALQSSNWDSRRDAEKHYGVMGWQDIAAMPVKTLAHPDGCHLFLWTTGPCLAQGLDVMRAWGFNYSAIAFTWVKLRRKHEKLHLPLGEGDLHVGLGLTTRKNTEVVLLGRRGSVKRLAKDVREVVLSPVREHSRKPDEVRKRIMRYCHGPYLELFAREKRPAWFSWGDEVNKYAEAAE